MIQGNIGSKLKTLCSHHEIHIFYILLSVM